VSSSPSPKQKETLYRDNEGAALERVSRLEAENAHLRHALAEARSPKPQPKPHRPKHTPPVLVALCGVMAAVLAGGLVICFRSSPPAAYLSGSPQVIHAPVGAKTAAAPVLLDTPSVPGPVSPRALRVESAFAAPANVAYQAPATLSMANNLFVTSVSLTDGSSVATSPDPSTSFDVVVDLGVARHLANVVIVWGPYGCSPAFPADDCNDGKAYIEEGSIEASEDGATYAQVATIKDPHSLVSTYAVGRAPAMPSTARYLRVRAQGTAPFSVYEIAAYETESAPTVKQLGDLEIRSAVARDQRWKTRLPPTLNVALGKSVTFDASASPAAAFVATPVTATSSSGRPQRTAAILTKQKQVSLRHPNAGTNDDSDDGGGFSCVRDAAAAEESERFAVDRGREGPLFDVLVTIVARVAFVIASARRRSR